MRWDWNEPQKLKVGEDWNEHWKTQKLRRVEGVLHLHKSGNELSLDLHKSGNELSLDFYKSGNELSFDLYKSGNELSLDLHKSGNELSLDLHINESPKWIFSLLDFF